MTVRVHETAIINSNVEIGEGTAVWDHVHIRRGTRIGSNCIVGEKSYIGPGVVVGDLVKINTSVYICTGVTIERGVMVSAHVVFTNDRYPRATSPDLEQLRPSEADESTLSTLVREGATIGAAAVVGPGIVVGRFAMIGMGSVVTRSVPDFQLVVGNPAAAVGYVCRCGEPLEGGAEAFSSVSHTECQSCGLSYRMVDGTVLEDGRGSSRVREH
jgi:acetyltransferase-like isoleucine patch superfamily enzyme